MSNPIKPTTDFLSKKTQTGKQNPTSWLDGINPASESGHISHRNRREIRDWIKRNNRLPTEEQLLKDISGLQLFGTRDSRWLNEIDQYIKELAASDPEIAEIKRAYDAGSDTKAIGAETFVWDESKLHQPGTKESELFDFYKNMGEAGHEIGQSEMARSERDMQVEMAGQRSQLIEEVRKRRQNQLRSGLSSAQVANEEIQMLLMGQQGQQQVAQEHFTQRTQMNQQAQMNPYLAEQQAREGMGMRNQNMAGSYAAYTGDAGATGLFYGSQSPKNQADIDYWLKDRTGD